MRFIGLFAVILMLSGCAEAGDPNADGAPSSELSQQDTGNTAISPAEDDSETDQSDPGSEPQANPDALENSPGQNTEQPTDETESTSSEENGSVDDQQGGNEEPDQQSENGSSTESGDDNSTSVDTAPPSLETVNGYIAQLQVAAEVSSGYDRDLFDHWNDDDRDGCNAREEVLILESTTTPTVSGDCNIQGRWVSAFDGDVTTNTSDFDVDHMVPLKEAWDSGANNWSNDRRERFANDLDSPYSLIAVSAGSNRSKGAKDPAAWMPPNRGYWCEYVYSWTLVKIRWGLSADPAEIQALQSRGGDCLVSEMNFQVESGEVEIIEDDSVTPIQAGTATLDPRYSSCKDAKSQGYGPYVQGEDEEYDWYRDGDSDGITCE